MATQTGSLDDGEESDAQGAVGSRLVKPYSSAYQNSPSVAKQADPFIDVAAKSRELASTGISNVEAINLATQMRDAQKKAALAQARAGVISLKEQLLAEDDKAMQLDAHNKMLDQRRNYQDALTEFTNVDPQSVNAKSEMEALSSKHANTLYGPNKSMSANLQQAVKSIHESIDDYSEGVKTHLSKYGMSEVPKDAVDPDTGRVDFSVIDKVGPAYFKKSEQVKLDAAVEKAKAIRGAESDILLERRKAEKKAQQEDPMYKERVSYLKERTKKGKLDELKGMEASIYSRFPKAIFSLSPESEKEGVLKFKVSGKAVKINKEEYESAKNKLQDIEDQKTNIDHYAEIAVGAQQESSSQRQDGRVTIDDYPKFQ